MNGALIGIALGVSSDINAKNEKLAKEAREANERLAKEARAVNEKLIEEIRRLRQLERPSSPPETPPPPPEDPYEKFERHRARLLRYLWIKTGRPVSANDAGFAESVTPISNVLSFAVTAAQGTEEIEAVLGVNESKLEDVFRAISQGKKIIALRKTGQRNG
jgi:hypothetical protein